MQKVWMIFFKDKWSMIIVCVIAGLLFAMQVRQPQKFAANTYQNHLGILSERLIEVEKEKELLNKRLGILERRSKTSEADRKIISDLRLQACAMDIEGEGIIVSISDSNCDVNPDKNPNLYLIHDDDLLRVVNELRAAGAEAISINDQRLISTSEIRCAGSTISVNNIRSAPPYEIKAIGNKKTLESSLKMRGGVADTLKIWGIEIKISDSEKIFIPAYTGDFKHTYSRVVNEEDS